MSARVADTGLARWPEELIAWAFVSSPDVVTVRTGAACESVCSVRYLQSDGLIDYFE